MASGTRCPYVSSCGSEVVRGAAAPKEPITYAFTHEEISLSPSSSGWEWGLWDEV